MAALTAVMGDVTGGICSTVTCRLGLSGSSVSCDHHNSCDQDDRQVETSTMPSRVCTLNRLGYRHTFNVRSCRSVQLVDDLAEVVDIVHVNPLIRQAFAERLIRAWIRPFHCERRRCHSLDTDNIFLYVRAVQPLPHKATSTHLERWTYRIQRVTRLSYPHAETGRLIRGVCPTRKTATCSPYSVFSSLHRFFT